MADSISIRDYVDALFEERAKAITAALAANEKRLDGMNEFRATLADSSRLYMPRLEYEGLHRVLVEKIGALENRVNARDDRGGGESATWVRIGLGVSILVNMGLMVKMILGR
jgi:hypothetical protein